MMKVTDRTFKFTKKSKSSRLRLWFYDHLHSRIGCEFCCIRHVQLPVSAARLPSARVPCLRDSHGSLVLPSVAWSWLALRFCRSHAP